MRSFTLAFCFLFSTYVFATSPFSMGPYFLRTSRGDILMRFQLSAVSELQFTWQDVFKGDKKSQTEVFHSAVVHEINLGFAECNGGLEVEVMDELKNEKIFSRYLEADPCHEDDMTNFIFLGDTQWKSKRHQQVAQQIENKLFDKTHFILHAGDVVQTGGSNNEWFDYFRAGKGYLTKAPVVTTVGNHAYRDIVDEPVPYLFRRYMRWPGANPVGLEKLSFAQFDLILFNSNLNSMEDEDYEEQLVWFKEELEWSRQKGRLVVVAMHHPPFSSSLGKFDRNSRMLRKKVVPIMELAGNVVLVLAGHTHLYERSYRHGIHYVNSGPAGGRRMFQTWFNRYRVTKAKHFEDTFSKFSINSLIMKMETFNKEGEIIDEFEIDLPHSGVPWKYADQN